MGLDVVLGNFDGLARKRRLVFGVMQHFAHFAIVLARQDVDVKSGIARGQCVVFEGRVVERLQAYERQLAGGHYEQGEVYSGNVDYVYISAVVFLFVASDLERGGAVVGAILGGEIR